MNIPCSSVETFRQKIKRALDVLSEKEQNLELSVLRGLEMDFDLLFPPEIYRAQQIKDIQKHIDRYCSADPTKCPICGSLLQVKTVRRTQTKFLGCSKYPECHGSRDIDGSIRLTSHIKAHIAQQLYHAALVLETHPLRRFLELEYE